MHAFGGERERSLHYQKSYARVTHIWGNHKGQPDPSPMKAVAFDGEPRIGAVKTNSMDELTSSKSAAQQVAYVSQ